MNDTWCKAVDEKLEKITEIVIRNTVSLEEHMRRTQALENIVEQHRNTPHARPIGLVGTVTVVGVIITAVLSLIRLYIEG